MGTVEPRGTTMKQALLGFVLLALASAQEEEVDPIEALSEAIPGSPGEDYPIYATPPETSFGCDGYIEGYYADPEAECQAFHICANFGDANLVKYSFLCPNGTLFNQQYFICDWWFNVDCSQAEDSYSLNEEVAAAAAAASAAGENGGSGESSNELASYTLPGGQSDLLLSPSTPGRTEDRRKIDLVSKPTI